MTQAFDPPGHTKIISVSRQRGVALVTALLVVSLATVVAVAMATRQHIDVRRTGNLVHGEQAYSYALAAESWARIILRRDAEEEQYDSLTEDWATALPPLAVEGGVVSGKIEDMNGRFNLNNLVDHVGDVEDEEVAYFKRLLDILGLDPVLAESLLDWIDPDINVRPPGGAEDEFYLLVEGRPYRAANRRLVSISELRLIKGFDKKTVELLTPHVTVLPESTVINVNTATPLVLRALSADLSESDVEALIADRGETGYENINDFLLHDVLAGLELETETEVESEYFRVLTDVVIGQSQAHLESLMIRDGDTPSVIYRVRGQSRLPPVQQGAQDVVAND